MARHNVASINSRARALVLDDETGIIDSVRVALERIGVYVDGTTNQQEAIEILKSNKHDIFIVDFLMDGMNGEEVINIIREFSTIYSILLTGHTDIVPPVETFHNLKIQGYCEKTFTFDKLLIAVETALRAREYIYDFFCKSRFKDILKVLMDRKKYKQEYIAEKLDVRTGTVIDWIKGNSTPGYDNLKRLAELFEVDTDLLLGRIFHDGNL